MSFSSSTRAARSVAIFLLIIVGALYIAFNTMHTDATGTLARYAVKVEEKPILGTGMSILLVRDESLSVPAEEAMKKAESEVRRLEKLMSSYVEESDISKIGRLKAGESVSVSPETWTVLMESFRYNRLSGGAFDITVGPLSHLYKFNRKKEQLPEVTEIEDTRKRVGSDLLTFTNEGRKIGVKHAGISITLGAIAKGYCVDRAMKVLISLGAKNALVEIGGEVCMIGQHPDGRNWHTGIDYPVPPGQRPEHEEYLKELDLTDCAVATSGNYLQYFEHNGHRYSHIIDPRTGLPVANNLSGVTIVAPTCTQADALATSVSVLGEKDGLELLKLFDNVKAYLQIEQPDGKIKIISYPSN